MSATAAPTLPACPRCGRALPADAPAGLCPRCLLSDGFAASEADFRVRANGQRFVPPTIEELAGEFPNLEFVRPLGSGGMGAVYLAKQIRLDRPIAVKVLPPDLADDAAFAERFLREARALARLSHPNIVGVFDFGQTPGGLYFFLMEYIEGPTLRQVVASRTTDPRQALEIVRQVCDALQFAHDKGVVHRDIKPENILLDGHGRVKIADFGLAKLLGLADTPAGSPAAGSLTHTKQAMGTPHYMAPEQIVGSRAVDHRADIYSLGVVFYELLTGDLPLGRFAPPSKKVQVDVRLDEVVLRTLEAAPEQRYQRAEDVRSAVDTISHNPHRGGVAEAGATAFRFVRDATADAGRAARTVLQPAGPGELSRYATFALLWWAAIPLALLCLVWFETFEREVEVLAVLFATIGIVLGPIASTAPVGASLLGFIAVREVRASRGRVVGLVPGLASALVVPVAAATFVCGGVPAVVAASVSREDAMGFFALFVFGLPLAMFVDTWLIRGAWRMATEGMSPELIERELSVVPRGLRTPAAAVYGFLGKTWRNLFGRLGQESASFVAAEAAVLPSRFTAAGPRPSWKARIGAAWSVAFPIGAALLFVVANFHPHGDLYDIAVPLLGLFAVPALTAPFATTALGCSAVAEIRRSNGRIYGLPLALFDVLAFPLLALDVVIAAVVTAVTMAAIAVPGFRSPRDEFAMTTIGFAGFLVGLVLCVVVDALIARMAWKRVSRDVSNPHAPAEEPVPADGPSKTVEPTVVNVPSRLNRDLWMAAIGIGAAAVLIGIKAFRDNAVQQGATLTPPTAQIYNYGTPVPGGEMGGVPAMMSETPGSTAGPADPDARWFDGPNGLELGYRWAQYALRIDDVTHAKISAVLRDVAAEYDRLLDAHTSVRFDGKAIVFSVEPFPAEYEALVDEFWAQVDPLLDRNQQSIMRYNFPLRYDASSNSGLTRYEDKLMPFGSESGSTSTIRISRSGQWYHWSGLGGLRGTQPELPNWLRRWQAKFDMLDALRKAGATIDPARLPLAAPKPLIRHQVSDGPFANFPDPFAAGTFPPDDVRADPFTDAAAMAP